MELEQNYSFECPHCGEPITVRVDLTAGRRQTFTQDCEVCCRPIRIYLAASAEGVDDFDASPE